MCPIIALGNVHWPSVVAAAAAAFVIGALWYSPLLFGNKWAAELGLSKEKIGQANMPLIFGSAFVLILAGAVALDLAIGRHAGLLSGFMTGLKVGILFIAGAIGVHYLFARKSFKLFLIDAGYFVVLYAVMGAVLGAW
ncbi:DUF1761 domain-containing protein [bacterium]|nr:DUF1761 domain-containing protein [bacterium]